jgi:hypothetical protein
MPENMTIVWLVVAAIGGALVVLGAVALFRLRKSSPESQTTQPVTQKLEPSSTAVVVDQAPPNDSTLRSDKPLVREVNIPVALTRLELGDIRSFSRLDLHFTASADPSERRPVDADTRR